MRPVRPYHTAAITVAGSRVRRRAAMLSGASSSIQAPRIGPHGPIVRPRRSLGSLGRFAL